MAAKGITSIEFVANLGNSPASTHRPSGKVWVNSSFLGPQMRKRYWDFILDHEEGHIVLDTKCEFKADAYASAKFFNKYCADPMDSVKALTEVLPMNTPEQRERVKRQTERAQKFDCEHNGKCKPDKNKISHFMPRVATNKFDSPETDNPAYANTYSRILTLMAKKKPRVATNRTGGQNPTISVSSVFGMPVLRRGPSVSAFNPDYGSTGYGIDAWGALAPMGVRNGPTTLVNTDYETEMSNFTNCSKYIIKSRRRNCEAENQRERDAQKELAIINNKAASGVGEQQSKTALGLADVLNQDIMPPPAEPQKNNTMMIAIVLIGAAMAIGAVLYFMGKKPA